MNQQLIKWLALGLCTLTVLAAVACTPADNSGDSTTPKTEVTTDVYGDFDPEIAVKNYKKDFNIVSTGFKEEWMLVSEDEQLGVLEQAVYERGVKVEDHLGVQLNLLDAGSWTEYSANIQKSVMAGDDDYHMVMTHPYQGITDLITSNSLYDIGELESVNLDAPYWNSDLMEDIKIGDQYLLGYNDISLASTHVFVFNKDIMEEYNITPPYQLVRDKQWTLETMMQMASIVHKDNGDQIRDTQDTYGLAGYAWTYYISFVTSSDMKIVDRDADGLYKIAYNNNSEKMNNLINTLTALYTAEYAFLWPPHTTATVDFKDGTSMFYFYDTAQLMNLRDADMDWGVLPYPLYDARQKEYRSLNWNGVMVVPASIKDPAMVGDVLEMMAYYTAPVKTAYMEDLLGTQLANAPEDAEMLNIIWDSQVSDVGIVTCNCHKSMDELVYMVPKMCGSGKNIFSSYLRRYTTSAQKALDNVFDQ